MTPAWESETQNLRSLQDSVDGVRKAIAFANFSRHGLSDELNEVLESATIKLAIRHASGDRCNGLEQVVIDCIRVYLDHDQRIFGHVSRPILSGFDHE